MIVGPNLLNTSAKNVLPCKIIRPGRIRCWNNHRWYVMAHAQKPDFVFRRNGLVHLNRPGGVSSVDYWQPRRVLISGSNAGYTMFRSSVKGTGYPFHSPVSPSLPLLASPCAITLQPESTHSIRGRVCTGVGMGVWMWEKSPLYAGNKSMNRWSLSP